MLASSAARDERHDANYRGKRSVRSVKEIAQSLLPAANAGDYSVLLHARFFAFLNPYSTQEFVTSRGADFNNAFD